MDFVSLLFYFIVIVPSAIIHEYAHGWMAFQLGDSTAKYAGRLTVDPRAHVDKWGTIILPVGLTLLNMVTGGSFFFAYAKPVPFNPYNLKNQKWGPALVAIAGPLANLLLAVCFAFLFRLMPGSLFAEFFVIIVSANIGLMVFNLLPIPPLDGSKILFAVLPDSALQARIFLERYGFFILIFFVLYLPGIISPIVSNIIRLLLIG